MVRPRNSQRPGPMPSAVTPPVDDCRGASENCNRQCRAMPLARQHADDGACRAGRHATPPPLPMLFMPVKAGAAARKCARSGMQPGSFGSTKTGEQTSTAKSSARTGSKQRNCSPMRLAPRFSSPSPIQCPSTGEKHTEVMWPSIFSGLTFIARNEEMRPAAQPVLHVHRPEAGQHGTRRIHQRRATRQHPADIILLGRHHAAHAQVARRGLAVQFIARAWPFSMRSTPSASVP